MLQSLAEPVIAAVGVPQPSRARLYPKDDRQEKTTWSKTPGGQGSGRRCTEVHPLRWAMRGAATQQDSNRVARLPLQVDSREICHTQ